MKEEWKPIAGYEGSYEVSPEGLVRSLSRTIPYKNGAQRTFPSVILRPFQTARGDVMVNLVDEYGLPSQHRVHRLVAETYNPNPSMYNLVVKHADGDKTNNVVSNLIWATRKSMAAYDKRKQRYNAKLSEEQVKRIREMLNVGTPGKTIAEQFGCSPQTVSRIKTGDTWRGVR